MARTETSTFTGLSVMSADGTVRDVCSASGRLYNLGNAVPNYNLLAIGNAASPSYTGYNYKLVIKSATTRNASRKWRIKDLKNIVFAGMVPRVSAASVAARKPGAPAVGSWFQQNKVTTSAGATLRMHFMHGNGTAATGDNVRVTLFIVGTV